jgi:ABC-type arginine/histidine transport system permease subunit
MIQALYSFRSAPLPCAKDLTLNELTEKGVMIVHDAELLNGAVFAITSLALKGAATLGLSVIEGFRCEVPLTRADISGAR